MVDFKKLSKISNASGEIVAKEHPDYDQYVSHAFQLGFQGGFMIQTILIRLQKCI